MSDCDELELWKGELAFELRMLEQVEESIVEADEKLNAMAAADARVVRLQSIPFVGPRLAELAVSTLDDSKRFNNTRQVSAYAGLVPKQYQSGTMDRTGRITGQGPRLLRRVLVQAAWGMQRKDGRGKVVFDRLRHGQKNRRKQAVVALARKIWVWLWPDCQVPLYPQAMPTLYFGSFPTAITTAGIYTVYVYDATSSPPDALPKFTGTIGWDGVAEAPIDSLNGSGGVATGETWSEGEKAQIRQALGVDGTKVPAASGDLQTAMRRAFAALVNEFGITSETDLAKLQQLLTATD